jgi:hypothetical protein
LIEEMLRLLTSSSNTAIKELPAVTAVSPDNVHGEEEHPSVVEVPVHFGVLCAKVHVARAGTQTNRAISKAILFTDYTLHHCRLSQYLYQGRLRLPPLSIAVELGIVDVAIPAQYWP